LDVEAVESTSHRIRSFVVQAQFSLATPRGKICGERDSPLVESGMNIPDAPPENGLTPRALKDAFVVGRQILSPRNLVRRFSPSTGTSQPPLGRLGSLEVKLAASAGEVRRAQALRYHVFFQEMSAQSDLLSRRLRCDADRFDRICDHLLVLDHAAADGSLLGSRPPVVGTYRLLRDDVAHRNGGFYTAGEFDIAPLIAREPSLRFLELGRSCVLAPYRNKRTVELLWHGVWSYVLAHRRGGHGRLRQPRGHRSGAAGS
jgi:putative hemolysin